MTNKHILLIGQPIGYEQLIDYALEQGCYITRTLPKGSSRRISPQYREVIIDILGDFEAAAISIRMIHEEHPIDAVISMHEFYQVAKCKLADMLGLPSSPIENVRNATHKYFMKERFLKHGVSTAKYATIDVHSALETEMLNVEERLNYPLIVKPCNGMGSIGVIKAVNQNELKRAIILNRHISVGLNSSSVTSESRNYVLVEEYIDGEEYTIDGFIINGRWVPMISCEKYPRMNGPVFQESYYMFSPLDQDPIPADLNTEAQKAIASLGVGNGPYHVELRRDDTTGKCYVIELAPRISGIGSTFYNLMLYAANYNIYDVYIRLSLGQEIEIPDISYYYNTLEIDTFAEEGGIISELKNLDRVLENPALVHYELFKKLGDYIHEPGLNPETTAVFYFQTKSRMESINIIHSVTNEFCICTGGKLV